MPRFFLALLACLLISASATADAHVNIRAARHTLKNGLEVVVVPLRRSPIVLHMLWLRAGGGDEPRGASGVAHYLEHMLFKAPKGEPPGAYASTIERLGGEHNAFTGKDYTAYHVTIAKEHLPAVMRLETRRMAALDPPDADFLSERDVIIEERYTRIDSKPKSVLTEAMNVALYRNHPYHIPLIGWEHEMRRLTKEDAMTFYHAWYRPNNALLLLLGDIAPEEGFALAEKHYGKWKSAPTPKRIWTREPQLAVAQTVTYRHPNVTHPQLAFYYPAPSLGQLRDPAKIMPFLALAEILGEGRASLLYQELVAKRKIAVAANVSYSPLARGPDMFEVHLVPAEGTTLERLARAYRETLAAFLKNGPEEGALARAKTRMRADAIRALDGVQGMGNVFGQLLMLGFDDALFNAWPSYADAVTRKKTLAAAREILREDVAVTGRLLPPRKGGEHAPASR